MLHIELSGWPGNQHISVNRTNKKNYLLFTRRSDCRGSNIFSLITPCCPHWQGKYLISLSFSLMNQVSRLLSWNASSVLTDWSGKTWARLILLKACKHTHAQSCDAQSFWFAHIHSHICCGFNGEDEKRLFVMFFEYPSCVFRKSVS